MIYELTFTAGEKKQLPSGTFFRIKTAPYPVNTIFKRNNTAILGSNENMVEGDWMKPEGGFSFIDIEAPTAGVYEFIVMNGQAGNDSKEVTALTRFDNLTPDGNRYIGGFFKNASAGTTSVIALYNPPGSTKSLFVSVLKVSCTSGNFYISKETVLTGLTDWTTLMPLNHNKKAGSPNGVGKIYAGLQTIALVDIVSYAPSDPNGAMTPFDFKNSPVEVEPGVLLQISGSSLNASVSSNFEWWEE